MSEPDRQIMAVVLTHNAPESLDQCIRAIVGQSSPPEALLIVDNASLPPVRVEELPVRDLPTQVVRSDTNTGPAGGYALALGKFLESGFAHAWVLDDDMHPRHECLERLWATAQKEPDSAFVFPTSRQLDGSTAWWPSWCGFVVARPIIEAAGLPMSELFWWAEDTEYLQHRIPQLGYEPQLVDDALVDHVGIRQGRSVPMWKYYYEARNMLYVHLYVKRKVGRYPRSVTKLFARALLRERHDRLRRLGVMMQGLLDGARGRLGIRYPVEPMHERPD